MTRKITLRSNSDVQQVLLDGKQIACDDGINMNEFLFRLCRELGLDYESEYGDWDDDNRWVPEKKRGGRRS